MQYIEKGILILAGKGKADVLLMNNTRYFRAIFAHNMLVLSGCVFKWKDKYAFYCNLSLASIDQAYADSYAIFKPLVPLLVVR
jgi:hypothetical protein